MGKAILPSVVFEEGFSIEGLRSPWGDKNRERKTLYLIGRLDDGTPLLLTMDV